MKHLATIFMLIGCLLILNRCYAAQATPNNVCEKHPKYQTRMVWKHHCNAAQIKAIGGDAVIHVKPQKSVNGISNYCVTLDSKKKGFLQLNWQLFKANCF